MRIMKITRQMLVPLSLALKPAAICQPQTPTQSAPNGSKEQLMYRLLPTELQGFFMLP